MATNKVKIPHFWHYKSMRLYLSLAFGLAVFGNAMIRNTLSMAMVCMVNSTTSGDNDQSSTIYNSSTCSSSNDVQQDYHGTFNWGSYEQGLMFSSLFVGGLLATIPAGWLADRYDPKMLVTLGIVFSSIGCFLSPVTATDGGYIGIIVLRFIMGLFGQALILPGISSISARWIPPIERSTTIALYTAGNQVASIIGTPMNALLCASSFLGGWEAIFYVNGVFGIVSAVIWMIIASNRPESNRFATEREKKFISMALESQNLGMKKDVTRKVPLPKVFMSPAVYSLFIMNFSAGLMYGTLTTYMPTYFKDVLYLSVLNNGFYGALPYIVQWLSKILFAVIAQITKKRTKLSPTAVCKIFNTISCVGVIIFLTACAYMDCTTSGLAIAFLCLANAFMSANVPGYQTSIVSIAPMYAGTMNAFSRVFGQFAAFLAPIIVSALTPQGTADQWKHVFLLISATTFVGGLVFLIFGSASIQDWAKIPRNNTVDNINEIKSSKVNDTFSEAASIDKGVPYYDNYSSEFHENDCSVDKSMHL